MSAFRDGARRVRGAPMMLLGLFAVTLLMALPLSYVLRTMIADHLGASLAANAAAAGANYEWWQEFLSQASGLGRTFVPFRFGGAADNILFHANEEQKQTYLLPTISGERKSCFAITEPGAGSDAKARLVSRPAPASPANVPAAPAASRRRRESVVRRSSSHPHGISAVTVMSVTSVSLVTAGQRTGSSTASPSGTGTSSRPPDRSI
jgi:hypothetical protein